MALTLISPVFVVPGTTKFSTCFMLSAKNTITNLANRCGVDADKRPPCFVLQGFIAGSGVHWAQDPQLKELVIQLGRPLHRVLAEQ